MIRQTRMALSLGIVVLCLAGVVTAQSPVARVMPARQDDKKGSEADDPRPKKTPRDELKDPTDPSPKIKDLLDTKGPNSPAAKASTITLRGRIIARDLPAAAILDVDGRRYTVGQGSVIPAAGGGTVKVIELNAVSIRLELSPGKEVIDLR